MLIFTSCIANYIPKARVLAKSLKKFHPTWEFCLVLGEIPSENFKFFSGEPFDRVITFEQLGIPNYKSWLFRHSIVEVCTAAKGPALYHFLVNEKKEKVIYLDPDIMLLNSIKPLEAMLDEHDILLTPHQLSPQQDLRSIVDNELCSLQHGIYNLGFLAVANRDQGVAFAEWWMDRLAKFCYDDIPRGIFTDQRWVDLAPVYFQKIHIIRDPGYNVASWNLTDRFVTRRSDGVFMANDVLLRFYHFTGYDSGAGRSVIMYYARNMPEVFVLWDMYTDALVACGHEELKKYCWPGLYFDNGVFITDAMRRAYRERLDIQQAFPDPFCTNRFNFYKWFRNTFYRRKSKKEIIVQLIKYAKKTIKKYIHFYV